MFVFFVFFLKNAAAAIKWRTDILEKQQCKKKTISLCFGDGSFQKYQSTLVGQVALVMLFLEPYKVIGSPTVEVWQT